MASSIFVSRRALDLSVALIAALAFGCSDSNGDASDTSTGDATGTGDTTTGSTTATSSSTTSEGSSGTESGSETGSETGEPICGTQQGSPACPTPPEPIEFGFAVNDPETLPQAAFEGGFEASCDVIEVHPTDLADYRNWETELDCAGETITFSVAMPFAMLFPFATGATAEVRLFAEAEPFAGEYSIWLSVSEGGQPAVAATTSRGATPAGQDAPFAPIEIVSIPEDHCAAVGEFCGASRPVAVEVRIEDAFDKGFSDEQLEFVAGDTTYYGFAEANEVVCLYDDPSSRRCNEVDTRPTFKVVVIRGRS